MSSTAQHLVPWSTVTERVRDVHSTLADLLNAVAEGMDVDERLVHDLSYGYGDTVVEQGQLVIPTHSAAPKSERSTVPLSLVLGGAIEVRMRNPAYDSPRGAQSVEEHFPLRILNTGDLFGVFEAADAFQNLPTGYPPTWELKAGVQSARLLLPMGDATFKKSIIKRAKDIYTYEGSAIGLTLKEISEFKTNISGLAKRLDQASSTQWSLRVVSLPTAWYQGENSASAALREYVYGRAWEQSMDSRRGMADDAWVYDVEKASQAKKCAIPLLRHLLGAGRGSRPVFVPHQAGDMNAGPLGAVTDLLREAGPTENRSGAAVGERVRFEPVLMIPRHLGIGESGYLSLCSPSFAGAMRTSTPANDYAEIRYWFENNLDLDSSILRDIGFDRIEFYHYSSNLNTSNVFSASGDAYTLAQSPEDIPLQDFLVNKNRYALYIGPEFLNHCLRIVRG